MNRIYWRVSYNNMGIYEALKDKIWSESKLPKEEWTKLKKSDNFKWLKIPITYDDNSCSYFTELGYQQFLIKTYPVIIHYLDESNIITEKYNFDENKINIVYCDEHQIVIKK